jgi:prophage regulatory protein
MEKNNWYITRKPKGVKMQHRFIKLTEVRQKTGLSKTYIYQKIKENAFPKQIPIDTRTVMWLESDIQQWMEDKINKAANQNNKPE